MTTNTTWPAFGERPQLDPDPAEGSELTEAERAALELAAATGSRVKGWLEVLAERAVDGADPAADSDGPRFGLGAGLRRIADTVAAVTGGIDPAGLGDVDFEQRYELTALVRHYVMEPVGRRLLSRAERVALLAVGALVLEAPGAVLGDFDLILPELCEAIDEALVLAGAAADGPAAALPGAEGDGSSDSVGEMITPARRPLGTGPATEHHDQDVAATSAGARRLPVEQLPADPAPHGEHGQEQRAVAPEQRRTLGRGAAAE
ncbi:hypothetical protein ACIA8O_39010 [Kitasatospora sp. NPDC051853]|uniref:hypothetical protein n=1 Tax=Kitasatospora sp. NPDC051853 TaxID=3364058 RepID=UPI0037996C3A